MIRKLFQQACVGQGFTAQNGCRLNELLQGLYLTGVPDTGVDPQFQGREAFMQLLQHGGLNWAALDSVEVGNVEMSEGIQVKQARHYFERFTGTTEATLQWLVGFANSAPGMNGMATGEIDNGNQVHG